jgi:hypothetical protein
MSTLSILEGKMKKANLLIMLLVLVIGVSGCGCTSTVDKAVAIIDNGIRAIQLNSDAWRSVLQTVANELPDRIDDTIKNEAQSLVNRSMATAGIEFRCNVDFLANRAIESLQRLKAMVLKQNPPILPPTFCQVDPASIDLSVDPTHWSTVMLSGYDLDHTDNKGLKLQVLLLDKEGRTTSLQENRIGRTTHYQITLNLGAMARQLYVNQIAKLVVSWGGSSEGYPQVVVVPWQADRQTIRAYNPGATGPYYPPLVAGDRDFDTGDSDPTSLALVGECMTSQTMIDCHTYMNAREVHSNYTEVKGWSAFSRLYSAPNGWRIVQVNPSARSSASGMVTEHDRLVYNRPAGEVVNYFEAWVDRDGDEAGFWTRVITHWSLLDIVIEEVAPVWLRS